MRGSCPGARVPCVALRGLSTAHAQTGPSAKSLTVGRGLQAPGPTRVSLPQAFLSPEVTAGDPVLLLGHILVLLGGVYLLVGQVRALPIPPTATPRLHNSMGSQNPPEANVESRQEGP